MLSFRTNYRGERTHDKAGQLLRSALCATSQAHCWGEVMLSYPIARWPVVNAPSGSVSGISSW